MSAVLAEKTATLSMAVVGCDFITGLGLTQLLDRADFIDVRGTVGTSKELLAMLTHDRVDIVVVDAAIAGEGLAHACNSIMGTKNAPRVVVMGDVPHELAESLVVSGVTAFLDPCQIAEDLPLALRMIHRGGAILLSDYARDALMSRSGGLDLRQRSDFDSLNARERVVAGGVAEGHTNVELALAMHLSEATIKLLVSNVMNKLGVSNRVQIAVLVTRAGIL